MYRVYVSWFVWSVLFCLFVFALTVCLFGFLGFFKGVVPGGGVVPGEGHCNNKTHRYGILKCMNKQGFCLFCVLILITRKQNSGYELIAAKGSNDNIVCNIIHMNINDELRLMSIYQSFKSDRTLGVDNRSNQTTKRWPSKT